MPDNRSLRPEANTAEYLLADVSHDPLGKIDDPLNVGFGGLHEHGIV